MKFNLRPTIFINGLILISIPLLFELAFAGTLFVLQKDYEKKLQEQIHANQIVAHTNEMWLGVMDIITGAYIKKIIPGERMHTRFHPSKVEVEYRELTKLLGNDPSQLPALHRMRASSQALINLSQSFEEANLAGGIAGLRGNLMQFYTLKKLFVLLGNDMVAFRRPWELRTQQAEIAIAEARNMITGVTISGVLISILLAALLFTYFMSNIYKGINNLLENTFRFASQMPLLPRSTRKDELAQLDQVFHEMAQSVEEASLEQKRLQQLKQDFFHMITHDMRTPLSSIVLSIESLFSGLAGEVSQEAMPTLSRAEKNVNMLMNLITDLLDLETAENQGIKLQFEEFDVKEALDEVAQQVESLASRAGVSVKVECDVETATADRIRILRILTNLVSNAIKFSPRESQVTVRAKSNGNRLEVEVIDKGRGIPADHLEAIFNRFQQVEKDDARTKKGTGLGLPIARTFVEAHGGKISVESQPGEGSRFWFWIPSKNASAGEPPGNDEISNQPA